jgi:hypothetical protein
MRPVERTQQPPDYYREIRDYLKAQSGGGQRNGQPRREAPFRAGQAKEDLCARAWIR